MNAHRAALLLVVLVCAAITGFARERLAGATSVPAGEKGLLYLPNGRHLRVLSLGHAPIVADAIYLWAIQYYSDYTRADRYRYVRHVFGNVIGELDPHWTDPYWLGSLILTVEARDLEAGLDLLDRGFEKNPDTWVLPYLAGWECYRVGAYERAASYFERAMAVPGAPPAVLRMRAGMISRASTPEEAIRIWEEVGNDPRADASTRAIARRQTLDLRVRADLAAIDGAVRAFRETRGRLPRTIEEVVAAGLLPRVPVDPAGDPYRYDRLTGTVSSAAGRVLGGAP